jgi:hypothetical protein
VALVSLAQHAHDALSAAASQSSRFAMAALRASSVYGQAAEALRAIQ